MPRKQLGEPEEICVGTLKIDRRYQRPLKKHRVQRIVEEWDDKLAKVPRVARREDGDYVIDGQHTVAAAQLKFGAKYRMLCEVFAGLSIQEQADMFWQQDKNGSRVSAADKFRARLVAEEPIAVAINDTVTRCGLSVGSNGATSIAAIDALERVQVVHHTLKPTLEILKTWDTGKGSAFHATLIRSVGAFIARYHKERGFEIRRVLEVLQKTKGEVVFLGKIKSSRDLHGGCEELNGALLILDAYNRRLQGRKLPPWSKD